MNEIILGRRLDTLIRRCTQIVMTLRHLANEQKQSSRTPIGSTKRLTKAGSTSSIAYVTEIGQIDKAIERTESNRYGSCAACHEAIEEARLETAPAAEFCSACQELRDGLRCL